ncbi:MAG: ABC transporter permease [Burkholderiales bacterium]|nr:ABC transporter permease [Phycisphaerae bacterium]
MTNVSGNSWLSRLPIPGGMKGVMTLLGLWTGVVLLFLYLPIIVLVAFSFNARENNVVWKGFSTAWYTAFFTQDSKALEDVVGNMSPIKSESGRANRAKAIVSTVPKLRESISNSAIIAVASTAISVVLGTGGAWLIHRYRYRFHQAINTLVAVPMIVPEIIMGVSLLVFFVTAGIQLGYTSMILAHVTFCFPYVLITVQARLAGLDPSLEEAAMDLGATPAQAFRLVILPYLWPGVISGALMAMTLSLDDFVVTYFCKGEGINTLPIEVYNSVRRPTPMLNVVSTLLVIGTMILVLLAEFFKRRSAVQMVSPR